jgi:quinol monooxygenase YgiN
MEGCLKGMPRGGWVGKAALVLAWYGCHGWGFPMLILTVDIQVKPECIEAFKAATLANARSSLQEAGVVRFDVGQNNEDPAKFVLLEVYRDAAGHAAHREAAHYATWRDTVADMMASPRTSAKYTNLFPADNGRW